MKTLAGVDVAGWLVMMMMKDVRCSVAWMYVCWCWRGKVGRMNRWLLSISMLRFSRPTPPSLSPLTVSWIRSSDSLSSTLPALMKNPCINPPPLAQRSLSLSLRNLDPHLSSPPKHKHKHGPSWYVLQFPKQNNRYTYIHLNSIQE